MNNLYSTQSYNEILEIDGISLISFSISLKKEDSSMCFGVKRGNTASYGLYAPFWLPDFLDKEKDYNKLEKILLDFILSNKKYGVKKIIVKLPPQFYSGGLGIFEYLLENHNFKIINRSLWQAIDLNKNKSIESYIKSLKYSSRKVIRKFSEDEIELKKVNLNDMEIIKNSYELINNNRKKNNVTLKYSFFYLLKLIEIEKEKIKIFDLKINKNTVASAICHLTKQDILYVAAWGDSNHSLNNSPMYCFALQLIKECLIKKIKIVDFGLSCDLNNKNIGLLKFKQNLNCFTTIQNTYELDL